MPPPHLNILFPDVASNPQDGEEGLAVHAHRLGITIPAKDEGNLSNAGQASDVGWLEKLKQYTEE